MNYIKRRTGTSFERFVSSAMHTMPFIAITVIIANYGVMGWATAALLTKLLGNIETGYYIAWAVGIVASLGRGSLVFLPNFDPDKPDFSKRGELSAVVFTIAFIYEIIHLTIGNGVSGTVAFISSFMQNVGAAALFLPVVSRISNRSGIPMSRLLMPMGFCAILGGTAQRVFGL